ncbi:MAG: phosphatase PAP2 family protein [Oscillospiraceae bacterium]|nr:phosphatase PAP2 family protein [Oscillospiraceae bacterium]
MTIFELNILDWLQSSMRTPVGDALMPVITAFADKGIGWILLTFALLLLARTRRTGVTLLLAICIEVLLCNIILKPLVARQRPFILNPAFHLLISVPQDYSFPSGHAAVSFACASVLWIYRSRWRFPAAVLAFIIAFSRLYLYVHFPTDVLAGAMIGIMAGAISCRILSRFKINDLCR